MIKNKTGGYLMLLVIVLSAGLLLFFFFRAYLTPAPPLLPVGETSATPEQNRVEQAHAYVNDAKATAKLMEGNNTGVNDILTQ